MNRKSKVKTIKGTNRKRNQTVDGIRSLRRNLDAQGGVKASETNSAQMREKDHVGLVENNSTSEISRGRRSRKESRVEICLGRSETSQRIKPPTTSSASSVGRMKVVVPAVQGESTTSSSSNMSTRDKTTSYFSMWNEALTDQVWDRCKFIANYLIFQVPKKRPVSGMMKPELSSVFYKFILSKANAIRAQGLQNEVDTVILMPIQRVVDYNNSEVNISSYPVTPVTGIFFSRAEIFKLGCFVQKYLSGTVSRYTVRKVYTKKSNSNGPLNNGKEGKTMY